LCDVVFDEHVFPFSKLHPNAGAQLRAELQLLPDVLLNPTFTPGSNSSHDHVFDSSLPANILPSSSGDVLQDGERTGGNSAGNCAQNGAQIRLNNPYFMCHQLGDNGGTVFGADPIASADAGTAGRAGSPSGSSPSHASSRSEPASPSGSSVQPHPPPLPTSLSAAAQTDPRPGGSGSRLSNGSAVAANSAGDTTFSLLQPGSSGEVPTVPRPATRSQSGIVKPKTYSDGTVWWCNSVGVLEEPTTLNDALRDKNWIMAMNEEHRALIQNGTWHLVPPPRGKNVIDCKWVYKIKRKANGDIERYKARLVAKGFKQRYGVDYEDTFSPVVKASTV